MALSPRRYRVHVQDIGWTDWVSEGRYGGTTGEAKRMEALEIEWDKPIEYRVHVRNIGWMDWVKNGEMAGTTGESLQVEAIEIKGANLWYHMHVQNYGWLDWSTNGEPSGTTGGGLRAEAIQILESTFQLGTDYDKNYIAIEPAPLPPQPSPSPAAQLLAGKRLGFDFGHGGSDPGAVGNVRESDVNLDVGMRAAHLCQNAGASVVITRSSDTHLYLSDRCIILNNAGCDAAVSVHHNGSSSSSAAYTMSIAYPGSTLGVKMGNHIDHEICKQLGTPNNGVLQRDDYMVAYTDMPAIITEGWFVTNPSQAHQYVHGDWAHKEAVAIFDGLCVNYA